MHKKILLAGNTADCPCRNLDRSRLEDYFRSNGCEITEDPLVADHILFVTCAFKQGREEECWMRIEEFQRYEGELIVLGCLPEICPARFSRNFKGRYVSTKNLDSIDLLFGDFRIRFRDVPDAHQYSNEEEYGYLRIGHGCAERCAYCRVYRAVGKLRSKPIPDCVEEYKGLLRRGYRKIQILADNVGAYGLDIHASFPELLNELCAVSDEEVHWHIQALHPRWAILYKSELSRMAGERRICEILCPIQSGSDRLLELMGRHHGMEELKNILLGFKRVHPHLRLTTHAIIGFPSETEEDLLATLKAIKEIRFDHTVLFPYYDGQDTIASELGGKIAETAIRRRLEAAAKDLRAAGLSVE